jgi:hypothetical protein
MSNFHLIIIVCKSKLHFKIFKVKQLFSSSHHIHPQKVKMKCIFSIHMPHSWLRVFSSYIWKSWKWNNYFHPHITFILKTWKMQYAFSSTCMPHSCFKGNYYLIPIYVKILKMKQLFSSTFIVKTWQCNMLFHPHACHIHALRVFYYLIPIYVKILKMKQLFSSTFILKTWKCNMLFHPHACHIHAFKGNYYLIPIYVKILKMKQLFSSTHHIHP